MIALNSGDKLRGDASIASKVDYTIHGMVSDSIAQLGDGQLADAEADIYTSPSNAGIMSTIILVNTHTSAITCNLYLKPSGGTSRRIIPKDITLGIGYVLNYDGMHLLITDKHGNIISYTEDDSVAGPTGYVMFGRQDDNTLSAPLLDSSRHTCVKEDNSAALLTELQLKADPTEAQLVCAALLSWYFLHQTSEAYIYSLAIYNGKLYAGTGSAGKIFAFDGTTWTLSYDSTETNVYSLAVYKGKLYAGCSALGKIFVFDGTDWALSYDSAETKVYSLAVYKGKLYAGCGELGKIFVFDNSDWSESYDSSEISIRSLAIYKDKLYAGCGELGKIFVFDNSDWSESYDSAETHVYSLAVYKGKLYAGCGGNGKIFVFDNSDWSLSYDSDEAQVYSLVVYNGKLYASSATVGKIFVFDNSDWSESYDFPGNYIMALATYDGKLYTGVDGSIYEARVEFKVTV